MITDTDLEAAELEFISKFKKLCLAAGGDLVEINKGSDSGKVALNSSSKSKLEKTMLAHFMHIEQLELH